MADSGSGFLELSVLELKLDKTIMEKQISICVEIDNKYITDVPISRSSKKMTTEIGSTDEIMELKICTGAKGKESNIGKLLSLRLDCTVSNSAI